ncbi:MAG: hypothetical protein KGO53_01215 [Alphaproteobacteria bacterium]|nr:hypothetical protein [Alphaproteobacteria bacterium]
MGKRFNKLLVTGFVLAAFALPAGAGSLFVDLNGNVFARLGGIEQVVPELKPDQLVLPSQELPAWLFQGSNRSPIHRNGTIESVVPGDPLVDPNSTLNGIGLPLPAPVQAGRNAQPTWVPGNVSFSLAPGLYCLTQGWDYCRIDSAQIGDVPNGTVCHCERNGVQVGGTTLTIKQEAKQ